MGLFCDRDLLASEVWRAKKTIFFKRSMGGGYADIENPVFFMENTDMSRRALALIITF